MGGCRGVQLLPFVESAGFQDLRREVVSQITFPTEVICGVKQGRLASASPGGERGGRDRLSHVGVEPRARPRPKAEVSAGEGGERRGRGMGEWSDRRSGAGRRSHRSPIDAHLDRGRMGYGFSHSCFRSRTPVRPRARGLPQTLEVATDHRHGAILAERDLGSDYSELR